jgi:hypothetical protein
VLIEETVKMDPVDLFLYWCNERHQIWKLRQAGAPRPWTDDVILQRYYFTNVYRELDKVTVWFRKNMREPLRDTPRVIFATVCFRWFNWIPTGEMLISEGLADIWDPGHALDIFRKRREKRQQIFTGAFMINSPAGSPKLEAIVKRITNVWEDRGELVKRAGRWRTLEEAHTDLQRYDGLGGFMAYEIVCDLRHTSVLESARDIRRWSNPGPGAIRGLYRILGKPVKESNVGSSLPMKRDEWLEKTGWLAAVVQSKLPHMPPFEARDVEGSLCEYDKYCRVLYNNGGKPKRTYAGA